MAEKRDAVLIEQQTVNDETINQKLAEGILQACSYDGISEVYVASTMSGAVVFSGTVPPMVSGALNDEERERFIRAFEE